MIPPLHSFLSFEEVCGIFKVAGIGEDMPWYTTALGAGGASLAAHKFLPKSTAAAIAAPVVGTALGLPIGKAIGKAVEKKAEEEQSKKSPTWDIAKTVGGGALSLGLGTAAGYGLGELANRASMGATGKPIPVPHLKVIAPVVGGAAGLAHALYKAQEAKEIERAFEGSRNNSG